MNAQLFDLTGGLTPLEIAYGGPLGRDLWVPSIDSYESCASPRDAFRSEILRALQRPPCVISFSGGRDSSTILAVAVDVAREEGLPPPIPATLHYPGVPEADESEWQDLVLDHLGITERVKYRLTAESEILGSDGKETLQRIGLRFPANLYLHLPIVRDARGGSLMTGFGGDELGLAANTLWNARALANGTASRRIRVGEALRSANPYLLYPREIFRRGRTEIAPWLTFRGRTQVRHRLATMAANEPTDWKGLLTQAMWGSRYTQLGRQSLIDLAAPHSVEVVNPFLEPPTLRALAEARPVTGYSTRAEILEELSEGLLPTISTRRQSKASFGPVMWGPETRSFARSHLGTWSGESCIDKRIINLRAIHDEWGQDRPTARLYLFLQRLWLNTQLDGSHPSKTPT